MIARATSVLVLAGCFAVGCTAIVYGDAEPARRDEAASSGGSAGLGGSTPKPSPSEPAAGAAGAGDPAGPSGGAGAAGEGGGGQTSGGAPTSGGANDGGAAGEPGHGGAGGEPASAEGGAGGDGAMSAAGSEAGGHGGAADSDGTAGSPPLLPGDPARGYKLVVLNNCYSCHGSDLAGQGFYRNITPDEGTGIGSWTDAEIARGIAGGTNQKGELLCASMPIYSGVSRQGMLDLIAFLRGIPARHNPITSVCPGHDP